MPSRKKWKYLSIGIVSGLVGGAGLVVGGILLIAIWPSSQSTKHIVLADIGCPSGMLENLSSGRCEASVQTIAVIEVTYPKSENEETYETELPNRYY
ncbi:MAG: hypothetical protein HOH43_02550 [Candidatus Latescibacteria bacterium]|jgi:hypothetical protein|nr:hypothetical protein [Candidatus Latescibacterota bacterium]